MEIFQVFLSYNRNDKPMAKSIAENLKDRGVTVWFDEWEVGPGDSWYEKLEKAIETATAAAVLIGKDGLGPWQALEVRSFVTKFVSQGSRVIPVLIPGAPDHEKLPVFLRDFSWIDFRSGVTPDKLSLLRWGITTKKTTDPQRKTVSYSELKLRNNQVSLTLLLSLEEFNRAAQEALKRDLAERLGTSKDRISIEHHSEDSVTVVLNFRDTEALQRLAEGHRVADSKLGSLYNRWGVANVELALSDWKADIEPWRREATVGAFVGSKDGLRERRIQVEVFVSYAREDAPFVEQIVRKLKRGGLGVWWDEYIPFGADDFSEEIEKAIRAAQCVLVVWSRNSKKKNFVKAEIHKAREFGTKVIHMSLDGEEPPIPFNSAQCEIATFEDGMIREDFVEKLSKEINELIGLRGPNEHLVGNLMKGEGWSCGDLATETPVPGLDVFLSFRPCGRSGVFLLMRLETTVGWVDSRIPTAQERHEPFAQEEDPSYEDRGVTFLKVANDVFFIMDPLRPYGIQIGGLRSMRPSAKPGIIEGDLSVDQLRYISTQSRWMSMTLAEILTTEEGLSYLWSAVERNRDEWGDDTVNKVHALIAKNPNAPQNKQKEMCLFCRDIFIRHRRLSSKAQENKYGASIIANDFPFGPAFHYIAIVNDSENPVHTWEDMSYVHARGMNLILHEFLSERHNRKGAAGITFGFNSTIRHLILGAHSHSSAGASIPHVHKQAWGMTRTTANLAERLIEVSQAYWNYNVDFQEKYFMALDESGYVVWKNRYVALYVPYGQCSKHELQAMVLQPKGCLTDLSTEEVKSLSIAEYIALRLFKSLNINSFNHVALSKLHNDNRAPSFRLVEAFITREIDLAVSELSMLFVVDQHPWDSRNEIIEKWNEIKEEVRSEVEAVDRGFFECEMQRREPL